MNTIEFKCLAKTALLAVCLGVALAIPVPLPAQETSSGPVGLPQDWSNNHAIYSSPDTQEEAAAKGTLDAWTKNANDPRFVLRFEKRQEKRQKAATDAQDIEIDAHAVATKRFALADKTAAEKGTKKKPPPASSDAVIQRDWSNVMGGASGFGAPAVYPAKYNFGVSSKTCADFVVFTTNSAGEMSSGVLASRTTGDFSGTNSTGTFIITNGTRVLTLTAGTTNSGTTFQANPATVTIGNRALNLRDAINRNGGTVGVTASLSGTSNGVKVTAITAGTGGNSIAISGSLNNIAGANGSLSGGSGTAGQPTIFALNNLYKDTVANGGCQTATQPVPATFWSYNTTHPRYSGGPTPTVATSFGPSGAVRFGPLSGTCTGGNFWAATTNPGACDSTVQEGAAHFFSAFFSAFLPAGSSVTVTVYKNGSPTSLTCTFSSGNSCTDLTHTEYFLASDVVAVRIQRTAGTAAWTTTSSFQIGGGTPNAVTSPVLSLDGTQVAFIQVEGSTLTLASLVLVKMTSGGSSETLGVPSTPSSKIPANYRGCSAPCMTIIPLDGLPADRRSSPFVDYANDILYVGDAVGRLHKFTGVFNGTPAEVVSTGANVWPAAVSGSALTSPVLDSATSKVFVGSTRQGAPLDGGVLHAVDTTIGSGAGGVTTSAQLQADTPSDGLLFDSPIVDSSTGKVYVFVSNDFANPTNGAVYQFAAGTSLAPGSQTPLAATVGSQTDSSTIMYAGSFDDTYYSGAGNTGFLYVCGYSNPAGAGTDRAPTLYRINMSAAFGDAAVTQGPVLTTNAADCSPITEVHNGLNDYIFVSVSQLGTETGCSGACVYSYRIFADDFFNTTSTSSTVDTTNPTRFMSVSASTGLNNTETTVDTPLTAANIGTYSGMTITQSAATPAGTTLTYTLRRNATNTAVTCAITEGNATCSDITNVASFPTVGDLIDVRVARTAGTGSLTATFKVQLDRATDWGPTTVATAGLAAPGGASGIIIDNTVAGGGSQIYYATRPPCPCNAVQASQAGLQ